MSDCSTAANPTSRQVTLSGVTSAAPRQWLTTILSELNTTTAATWIRKKEEPELSSSLLVERSSSDGRGRSHGLCHVTTKIRLARLAKVRHPTDITNSIGIETRKTMPRTSPNTLATAPAQTA